MLCACTELHMPFLNVHHSSPSNRKPADAVELMNVVLPDIRSEMLPEQKSYVFQSLYRTSELGSRLGVTVLSLLCHCCPCNMRLASGILQLQGTRN